MPLFRPGLLIAAILFAGVAGPSLAAEVVVLDGARLFDGRQLVDDSRIVIEGGRVKAAGPKASTPLPTGAIRRDVSGKTIIPGLIAAHSHVGMVNGLEHGGANYTRETVSRDLAQFQRFGVVAVNALGMNRPLFHDLRREWQSGNPTGADLYGAGAGVGVVDGAPPARMNAAADQVDRPTTPEAARAAVNRMADAGIDMVKIWVDDLGGTAPKLRPDVYRAAIEQAHARGLKAAAHIHSLADAKAVVEAGADVVGHGVRDQPVDRAFIDLMLAKGAWYVPTININEADYIFAEHPEWLADPFFRAAINPAIEARLKDEAWRKEMLAKAANPRRQVAINTENLRRLHAAGVKIGFGTDSGATALRLPGFAEHLELGHMVAAGMTPVQALAVATRASAEMLGATDRGCLWQGCRADLLILSADPTVDIANSRSIEAVWRNGRAVR